MPLLQNVHHFIILTHNRAMTMISVSDSTSWEPYAVTMCLNWRGRNLLLCWQAMPSANHLASLFCQIRASWLKSFFRTLSHIDLTLTQHMWETLHHTCPDRALVNVNECNTVPQIRSNSLYLCESAKATHE